MTAYHCGYLAMPLLLIDFTPKTTDSQKYTDLHAHAHAHTQASLFKLSVTVHSPNDESARGPLIQLYLHVILSGDFFVIFLGTVPEFSRNHWTSKKRKKLMGN